MHGLQRYWANDLMNQPESGPTSSMCMCEVIWGELRWQVGNLAARQAVSS